MYNIIFTLRMSVPVCKHTETCPIAHLCCFTDRCCYGLNGVESDAYKKLDAVSIAVLSISLVTIVVLAIFWIVRPCKEKNLAPKQVEMQALNDSKQSSASEVGEEQNSDALANVRLKVYPLKTL